MPGKYHKKTNKLSFFENSFSVDSNQLLIVSLLLLVLITIICFGLWGYQIYLSRDIEESVVGVENLQSQRDLEMEANFADLKIKIEDLKKILDVHVYPSKILNILEELTISQIKFIGLEANLLEANLVLEAEAIDYKTLAEQIVIFENDSRIKEVDLSGVQLNDSGRINSDLKIEIDRDFLHFK